jgi:hypothetical protein
MLVTQAKIQKIEITEVKRLDRIGVFIEDIEPGEGRITIEVYGRSWTSYWPAMSGRLVSKFFMETSNDYLIGCLSNVSEYVIDEDELIKMIQKEIIGQRRHGAISEGEARELFDDVACSEVIEWINQPGACEQFFECEIWEVTFPQKINHEYEYHSRIVDAVKAALKEVEKDQVIEGQLCKDEQGGAG